MSSPTYKQNRLETTVDDLHRQQHLTMDTSESDISSPSPCPQDDVSQVATSREVSEALRHVLADHAPAFSALEVL